MHRTTLNALLIGIALFAVVSPYCRAGEKAVFPYCPDSPCYMPWKKVPCWCPDDYCPKCLPPVKPVCPTCCDDYCRKLLPCTKPFCGGCCDDYCPKKGPIRLDVRTPPWYQCGSGPSSKH